MSKNSIILTKKLLKIDFLDIDKEKVIKPGSQMIDDVALYQ